jgi:3-hydroxyacyl-[acyl-carrier-protein] dehydratase
MRFESALQIPIDHAAFAGHFPGTPIVPGVVLLDAVVHAARAHLAPPLTGNLDNGCGYVCQISSAKFLSPVGPGELLTLIGERAPSGAVHFSIVSDSRKVATGTLMFSRSP